MKIDEFNIGKLHICCAIDADYSGIAYILYPMDIPRSWIKDTAIEYGVSIVVISNLDWDNELTPWPAPGQPKGCPDFKGNAPGLLRTLTSDIIPAVEEKYLHSTRPVRTLTGVSLSGLFTLWQWPQSDVFTNIGTLSGSYWYPDFEQWIFQQSFSNKRGKCYMLLGKDEPLSNTPTFRRIGICTENIVGYLRRQGVDITFNIVPGNHFQHAEQRLNMTFHSLFGTSNHKK